MAKRAGGIGLGLALAFAGVWFGGSAAVAAPAPATFAGSCSFAGPISPGRPITLLPVPTAHFSYSGRGTCDGSLDGRPVRSAPLTVSFTDVTTLFDTCEFGPDFN